PLPSRGERVSLTPSYLSSRSGSGRPDAEDFPALVLFEALGDVERKSSAFPLFGAHADLTVVRVDDKFADRQSQPRPATRAAHLLKLLKDPVQEFRRHAVAGVRHLALDAVGKFDEFHRDKAAVRRELDGVAD